MRHVKRISFRFLCLLLSGCGAIQDPRAQDAPDLLPPAIRSTRALGTDEVEIVFDEAALIPPESLSIQPALSMEPPAEAALAVIIQCGPQTPGTLYMLSASARDERGNSVTFAVEIYGFNPNVPRILINELITQGSDTHPDLVELKALSDGDMGGLVIYQGGPGDYTDRLVFPSFSVSQGAFILVHFKPSGSPEEMDETVDMAVSGGLDASVSAFDFWVSGGTGLSGNNGVISLYDRPGGEIVDGILYSNRTSDSDSQYRGFGTASTLKRADELVAAGGWRIAGEKAAPEDAVSPEESTATRSICRSSASADTDGREDWHIVPTKGSTFGAENSDAVYVPK